MDGRVLSLGACYKCGRSLPRDRIFLAFARHVECYDTSSADVPPTGSIM